MAKPAPDTRQTILQTALKQFAEKGYAGTSVQEIVDAARVTKPTLYYHFQNKADLFGSLVGWAHEERHRLMLQAVARSADLTQQLIEICAVSFEFIQTNRELMRLAFATAFAAGGEVPAEAQCLKRGKRSFDFVHDLMKQAAARGELSREFDPEEMTMSFMGVMNFHVMVFLIGADYPLNRRTAQRIVELFLAGAKPA